jgi:hypothetical protein
MLKDILGFERRRQHAQIVGRLTWGQRQKHAWEQEKLAWRQNWKYQLVLWLLLAIPFVWAATTAFISTTRIVTIIAGIAWLILAFYGIGIEQNSR